MTTLAAKPAPTGNIRDLVAAATRDRALFAEVTASESMRCAVYEELERVHHSVGEQMSTRSHELAVVKEDLAAGAISEAEARRKRHEYLQWHSSATKFRAIISERMADIRPAVCATHKRLSDQGNAYRELVIKLGKVIYLHQAEEIGDPDLYAALEATMPQGLKGEDTLFNIIARVLREETDQGEVTTP